MDIGPRKDRFFRRYTNEDVRHSLSELAYKCKCEWDFVDHEEVLSAFRDHSSCPLDSEIVPYLIEKGYLINPKPDRYQTTELGRRFGFSRLRRYRKETGEKHFKAFMERVKAFNADHTQPMFVTEVLLHGSLRRPEMKTIGDVDLFVEHSFRYCPPYCDASQEQIDAQEACLAQFRKYWSKKLSNGNYLAWEPFFADDRMRVYLQGGSGILSIHGAIDRKLIDSDPTTICVYRATPPWKEESNGQVA